MNELIQKIKTKGYWKVAIHPNQFRKDLISSTEELKRIIEKNKLSLRGWDYPHFDEKTRNASSDSIESVCDWPEGPKFEYWKYYQSGQFVHYFILREDYRISDEKKQNIRSNFVFQQNEINKVDNFLDIIGTLYTLTEIFQFASRLAEDGYLGDSFTIEIELNGVNNRALFFWDVWRHLNMPYICHFDTNAILIKKEYTREDIIRNANEYALDTSIKIFTDFNWSNVNRNIFIEDQRKFLERRI